MLRPEGLLFLNLGDSYYGSGKDGGGSYAKDGMTCSEGVNPYVPARGIRCQLKPKDLCGIPWRVAFALQADGWWLRMDNIWAKPNPMPESVSGSRWERHRIKIKGTTPNDWIDDAIKQSGIDTGRHGGNIGLKNKQAKYIDCPGCPKCTPNDGLVLRMSAGRPTRSHEYIFELAKSDSYYFDSGAVKEKFADKRMGNPGGGGQYVQNCPYPNAHEGQQSGLAKGQWNENGIIKGRNIRSVWTMATKPFKEAHFATFPPELPERCIKAGTSERGVCPKCGAPWVRVIEARRSFESGSGKSGNLIVGKQNSVQGGGETLDIRRGPCVETKTIAWRPSCTCTAGDPIPATVLDPFAGAGTTGVVAKQLGRDFILIELKREYCEMAEKRIGQIFYQRRLEIEDG